MKKSNILKEIIFLPEKFNNENNELSFYTLLKNTGYIDYYKEISENDIALVISNNLVCIEYWLQWSEDKRGSSGWYFLKKNQYLYEVNKIGSKTKINNFFINSLNACSHFIKKEIDDIICSGNSTE
jgi:hypothetical protein|tara:strand:- start:96 stop:473 length:378 start_codon:yes stop_codon:yes gene_type:complete